MISVFLLVFLTLSSLLASGEDHSFQLMVDEDKSFLIRKPSLSGFRFAGNSDANETCKLLGYEKSSQAGIGVKKVFETKKVISVTPDGQSINGEVTQNLIEEIICINQIESPQIALDKIVLTVDKWKKPFVAMNSSTSQICKELGYDNNYVEDGGISYSYEQSFKTRINLLNTRNKIKILSEKIKGYRTIMLDLAFNLKRYDRTHNYGVDYVNDAREYKRIAKLLTLEEKHLRYLVNKLNNDKSADGYELKGDYLSVQYLENGKKEAVLLTKENIEPDLMSTVICSRRINSPKPVGTSLNIVKIFYPIHLNSKLRFSENSNLNGVCIALGYNRAVGRVGKYVESEDESFIMSFEGSIEGVLSGSEVISEIFCETE